MRAFMWMTRYWCGLSMIEGGIMIIGTTNNMLRRWTRSVHCLMLLEGGVRVEFVISFWYEKLLLASHPPLLYNFRAIKSQNSNNDMKLLFCSYTLSVCPGACGGYGSAIYWFNAISHKITLHCSWSLGLRVFPHGTNETTPRRAWA